ncbi:MAG: hypothetical protein CYPHOPRED_002256 [Cyphobasidiales sp. Tagirdzhanova-0007]|nr:MAG: hypothetical protein CYPHOPRED_002256 [Cyphobasidiales sp. Tagirdzhanova-0007]
MGKDIVVDNAPKRIKYLQFGILSPQEIVAISEFEATQRDLYQLGGAGSERTAAPNGVLDKRLGTSEKSGLCETCGQKMADCVGHFAYIRLVLPVFHIGYFKMVIAMLQNICKSCSHVLLDEEKRRSYLRKFRRPHLENVQRTMLAKQVNMACRKVAICPHCGEVNGVVKKVGALKILHEKYRSKKMLEERKRWEKTFTNAISEMKEILPHLSKAHDDLNPLRVFNLFKQITAADCELLGLDPAVGRPEEFIWQYLSVPPVCIRPSVPQESATNEDDLTIKLTEIIFTNALIKTGLSKGVATQALMEQWEFLQLSVAMYINAEMPGVPSIAGQKPIRGLCQRLKGKQGRFRGNLSGKRVDFSGRTVISPDPNLRIDEVAVPQRVAKVLTFPDRVTPHNIDYLRDAVINGVDVWPGANFATVAAMGGYKRFLKFGKRDQMAAQLAIGDIVERHLRDGDVVLFNRQPSLHKLSIMSHRAKIRPWRTFRMNECVCTPYNADFDGDEMNLHVPQTEEARTEAIELMNIKANLVTPRNGVPLIAATQDFITASFLITRKDTFFDRQQFCQIVSYFSDARDHIDVPPPTILRPCYLWTGKQVMNALMRPNKKSNVLINLEASCKTMIRAKVGEIPDMSPNDGYLVIVNSEIMCGVFDKATVGDGKKTSVFAVIQRDYGADEAAKAMGRLAKVCARWLSNRGFSIGISDVTPGSKLAAEKELFVQQGYDTSLDLIRQAKEGKLELAAGMDLDGTLESSVSGILSKVRDKCADVCFQELSRHNAPLTMAVCGSKGSNLNVAQMVACVGQQIISGHRIPDGFPDRSLPHFPKKSRDPPSKGFVANSFYSGLTATEFIFHAVSGREGLVDTAVKTAETGYMQRRLMKALEDLTTRYDLSVRNSVGGIVQFTYGDDALDPAAMESDTGPVALDRTWRHAIRITPDWGSPCMLPFQIWQITEQQLGRERFTRQCQDHFIRQVLHFISDKIVEPAKRLRKFYGLRADGLQKKKSEKAEDNEPDHATLAVVDNKTRVTKKQLKKFLDLCWSKYVRAKIEPGTAVGAVGAQSIGEPGTQMTLKTFHFAGVAAMNITLGVPRIKEIINASKNINTPFITAELVAANSEQAARIVQGRIEKTYLRDIAAILAPTYHADNVFLSIQIDMMAIRKLQLEVSLDSIAQAILQAPKLKLQPVDVRLLRNSNKIRVYAESGTEEEHARLMQLARQLPHIVVKGVSNCSRAIITEEVKGHKKLVVEGNGLREVMTTDGVVGEKTISNHILDVYHVLGIEAARKSICDQIDHTMSSHGLSVDARHTMLLGDVMCFKGEILGITRFGVAKLKDSTLMLASFEKTTDHLFEAAFHSKRDSVSGISEAIIMGMPSATTGSAAPALVTQKPKLARKRALLFDT